MKTHARLFEEQGAAAPGFVAFASSVIDGGTVPAGMDGIRARLTEPGLAPYDGLNLPLMDAFAEVLARQGGR